MFLDLMMRPTSANRRTVDFTASGMALMWHKNTVHWRTPKSTVTYTDSDSSPSTITFIFLFVKKSHIQAMMLPSTPYNFILWGSFLCGTRKANMIMSIWDPISNFQRRSLVDYRNKLGFAVT